MASVMPDIANSPQNTAARRRPRQARTLQDKLRLMEPVLAAQAALYAGERLVFVLSSGRCTRHFDKFLRDYATRAGSSASSLYRWLRRFKEHGVEGLGHKERSDKGRSVRLRGAALIFVFAKWAGGRSASSIRRELAEIWPRLQGCSRPPSLATVRRQIRKLTSAAPRREGQLEEAQP